MTDPLHDRRRPLNAEELMNDLVFIGWALLFFALSWGFIKLGEKL
jgi:hypothetical protein